MPGFFLLYDAIMSGGHHLILGTTTDYITGESVTDTHDEQYRQAIARLLVERKGYDKADIRVKVRHDMDCGDLQGFSITDFVVTLRGRLAMIVKYGPGSIVSRERPAIAAARTITPGYAVPIAVVTNGTDAEIIDVATGSITGTGLEAIPSKTELLARFNSLIFAAIPEKRLTAERRILMAYDGIEHSCGCAEDWCGMSHRIA
jgi:hypothetical protein